MTVQEVKAYLKTNKITYQELSDRSSIALNTLKSIFSGRTPTPRIDTWQMILSALGLEEQKTPPVPELTEDEKRIAMLIAQMTEKEVEELETFVDYIISKRAK